MAKLKNNRGGARTSEQSEKAAPVKAPRSKKPAQEKPAHG